ncbi:hypothetical protein PLA106_11271 [Pseudomonas amygdali pv. lachrymans str. M302278]|nr:hypothetical protein PLA106_11271 [Pseudomonas amygdali pv. lachrymans str. M302278]
MCLAFGQNQLIKQAFRLPDVTLFGEVRHAPKPCIQQCVGF